MRKSRLNQENKIKVYAMLYAMSTPETHMST